MARPKTYIIKLSDDERAALQKTIKNKNTCKTVLKRCQILLELDDILNIFTTYKEQLGNGLLIIMLTVHPFQQDEACEYKRSAADGKVIA